MIRRTAVLATLIGLSTVVAVPIPSVAAPDETLCALALTDATGQTAFTNVKGLSIINLTAKPGPFQITQAEGEEITAVQCARSDLVPADHDDKVVLAGYPLFISMERKDGEQVTVVLETANGLFQVREVNGKLTQDEITRIGAQLDVFNDRLSQAGATQ
jgi:hypothetical protein